MKYPKVLITGAGGFVGKNLVPYMKNMGYEPISWSHTTYNLCNFKKASNMFEAAYAAGARACIHLAAKCGGIGLNQKQPADLFRDNMEMGMNVITCASMYDMKVVNLSTICAYPCVPPRIPFMEEDLWEGYPEPTNAPYAIAKKAVMVMGNAYRQQYGLNFVTLMPTNVYGAHDHFNETTSHVIPALITKFQRAIDNKEDVVKCWGTGKPTREFLYVEDLCIAIVKALEHYDKPDPVNISGGLDGEISIKDLTHKISKYMNFYGDVIWDDTRCDGQPRRCLNGGKAYKYFGYNAKVDFDKGLKETIQWYRENINVSTNK